MSIILVLLASAILGAFYQLYRIYAIITPPRPVDEAAIRTRRLKSIATNTRLIYPNVADPENVIRHMQGPKNESPHWVAGVRGKTDWALMDLSIRLMREVEEQDKKKGMQAGLWEVELAEEGAVGENVDVEE